MLTQEYYAQFCYTCGEGYTSFCRGKTTNCPMKPKKGTDMTQVAALLKSNKPEKASIEFTQSDLQLLKVILAHHLETTEEDKKYVKKEVQYVWEKAEKGTEDGDYYFKNLNKLRNLQRLLKQRSNKLAKIQQKVKKQLSK